MNEATAPHVEAPLPLAWGEQGIIQPETAAHLSIREKFEAFHAANPHVFEEFTRRAMYLLRLGHERFGAKAIFEGMRWDWIKVTDDPNSDFKLNNNYTAHYARLAVAQYPQLDGFFKMRTRRSDT